MKVAYLALLALTIACLTPGLAAAPVLTATPSGSSISAPQRRVSQAPIAPSAPNERRAEPDQPTVTPAAGAVAFTGGFSVLFREGLEAVLLLAAALAVVGTKRARRALFLGALAAVAATGLTWLVAERLLDIAPASRELISALTALAAVLLLIPMSFWLSRQAKSRHGLWRQRLQDAAERGLPALAGLAFASTYREGFETVLFYQALLRAQPDGRTIWLGIATAAVALTIVGWVVTRLEQRLPTRQIFPVLVAVTAVFAVILTGNAAHGFQEAGWLPETPLPALQAWLAPSVSSLTGLHATAQTLLAQGLLTVTLLLVLRRNPNRAQ